MLNPRIYRRNDIKINTYITNFSMKRITGTEIVKELIGNTRYSCFIDVIIIYANIITVMI